MLRIFHRKSEVTFDTPKQCNGRGSRLRVKRQATQFWYVVLLSLSVTEGNHQDGGSSYWECRPTVSSKHNENIIPPSERDINAFSTFDACISPIRGGAAAAALNPFPAGYNPLGYGLTSLGKEFLEFEGSLDSDVGRFLSTLKSGQRKSKSVMKEQWLEIVRVSKKGQSMRIYRGLDELIEFCLRAGFID